MGIILLLLPHVKYSIRQRMRRNYSHLPWNISEFPLPFIRAKAAVALKKKEGYCWRRHIGRFSQMHVLKIALNHSIFVCVFVDISSDI